MTAAFSGFFFSLTARVRSELDSIWRGWRGRSWQGNYPWNTSVFPQVLRTFVFRPDGAPQTEKECLKCLSTDNWRELFIILTTVYCGRGKWVRKPFLRAVTTLSIFFIHASWCVHAGACALETKTIYLLKSGTAMFWRRKLLHLWWLVKNIESLSESEVKFKTC